MDAWNLEQDGYVISTDKSRLDLDRIADFLINDSYWAHTRPRALIPKSVEHSLCFGVYRGAEQVGFARVVTDYATFAWLCDVFIVEAHRGKGLARWLIETVVSHPELRGSLFLLATRDAHELYRKYGGFEPLHLPERWMQRSKGR
ncbi:MAG: GNAT family N-acetyltransferase [Anaerolineae bacterium]|nr:GNAT family N-acetyltransferase [Anaerolineae bacterium]